MKNIPNILSFARIPLSIALLFVTGNKWAFLALYIVTGLTDVLDGFLARRFHWCSKFGAKLDGFADIVFMLSLLGVLLGVLRESIRFEPYVLVGVAVLAALKLFNLFYTKKKFKQWATMHTSANRYSALPFYFVVPAIVWFSGVPKWLSALLLTFLCVVFVANLEETLIIARSKEYDADTRSYRALKKQLTIDN